MKAIGSVLLLASAVTACSYSRPTFSSAMPASPTPVAAPNTGALVVFTEPATGFSTTDVHDAHDRIIQFTTSGDLVWTPDGTHIPGYPLEPYAQPPAYGLGPGTCAEFCDFSIRFGARDGQRHAYMTIDYGHSNPGTMVDVEVIDHALLVTQTSFYPPGTPTLSGVITEVTPTGLVPLSGAWVDRSVPGGWQSATTDENGRYRISGLIDGTAEVAVGKNGYREESRQVTLAGDTQFDLQLVRR
jgi:Carboxypeptidase regulatory-like domain